MIRNASINEESSLETGRELDEPLFSIVTATYNCKEKLDRTITSVLSQSFKNLEYILVDGASCDGTFEWLARVTDRRVKAFSEPDDGVYHAMNKGLQRARGEYVFFLGAGDELLPGALAKISQHLPKGELAMVYGDVLISEKIYDGRFSKLKMCHQNICHQSIFYNRQVFYALGGFNLKYRALADWEFNIRCFGNERIRTSHVPITVAIYEEGGLSSRGDEQFHADKRSMIWRHFGWRTWCQYEFPSIRRLRETLRRVKRALS